MSTSPTLGRSGAVRLACGEKVDRVWALAALRKGTCEDRAPSAASTIIEPVFDLGGAGDGRDRAAVVAELRRKLDAMEGGSQGSSVLWESKSEYDASLGRADSFRPAADSLGHAESLRPADSVGQIANLLDPAADATPVLPRIFDPDGPVLAAPGPIAAVLPAGGLPRGSVITVNSAAPGGGATSLLLALMAAPKGAWVAAVGLPDLGVLAAEELGVDLSRLGLVPYPGAELLSVIAVLSDGVDVIASASPMGLPGGMPPARQRVLTGRLREGGAVLLVAGRWPGADLAFTVRDVRWSGIGAGHGRLRDRELDVEISGRRAGAGMGAVVTLALRAGRDRVMVGVPDAASTAADAAADAVAAADVGVARAVGR